MNTEEAESALIGGLFLRNNLDQDVFDVLALVPESAFMIRQHQHLFAEIKRQAHQGIAPDPFLISSALGAGYEAIAVAATANRWASTGIKNYADMVLKHHHIREAEAIIVSAQAGLKLARNNDESFAAIQILKEAVQNLTFGSAARQPIHINDLLDGLMDRLEARCEGREEGRTILTGLDELDALTGGLDLTDLILLAARPSVGKTEFALNLIDKISERGGGVLLFSMEMAAIQIAERQVAGAGGFSTTKIKKAKELSDEDWARISNGIARMTNRPIWIDDASELSLEQICNSAERHSMEHPELAIIFVDYLGLVRLAASQRHDIAVGEVSRGLKSLAKRIRRPVVALSQLSRGVEQRMNKRPVNADLKDSGSIEADADLIMMLYRDELYDENSPAKGLVEINLTKNRNGPLGTIYRQFRYGHFLPIDQVEAEKRCRQQPEEQPRRYGKRF